MFLMGLIRGYYFTKKRKREFELMYDLIAKYKRYIWRTEIEIETHFKYKRFDEIRRSIKSIKEYEKELKKFEEEGWSIDYEFNYI